MLVHDSLGIIRYSKSMFFYFGQNSMTEQLEQATLGGGCFWCTEAVFNHIEGVKFCESGYSGDENADPEPSYKKVCTGQSGHAEVVRLHYNPDQISYRKILAIFFAVHDPTTLNQQGNDIGPQYRSVIFYHNANQEKVANELIKEVIDRKIFKDKLVTQLEPLKNYFKAEDYHQRYFENNPMQPYCAYVIAPKIEKAEDLFSELFKK